MSDGTFVYDDECGFCTWLADYFGQRTTLELVGFSELADGQRERLPADFEECSHLVTDEAIYSCGAAIEQGFARADVPPGSRDLFDFLRQFEDYERLRERVYWEFADRRSLLGQFVWKEQVGEGTDRRLDRGSESDPSGRTGSESGAGTDSGAGTGSESGSGPGSDAGTGSGSGSGSDAGSP